MAELSEVNYGRPSDDGKYEMLYLEPIYDAFICPLTKQVMRDPVTLETGQTFERVAIEKWLRECKVHGRKPSCPITKQELSSTHLNSSVPLRNTIQEWNQRNDAAQLDFACSSLSPGSSESQNLRALKYVQNICQKSRSYKHVVREAQLIPMITSLLKSSSSNVRCKALETLRFVVEDDDNNKEAVAAGDTVRTIFKFLARELTQEKEEAVLLLHELSKLETLSEKIGSVTGGILLLVGLSSSKAEDIQTVQEAEKTLVNLEKCEANVLEMAKNGRLRPLLRLFLEGSPDTQLSTVSFLGELVLSNDVKVLVAETAGSTLVNVMSSGSREAREAALKALNQISSCETSARILIKAGILPPLIKDLFSVDVNQIPAKLKTVSATILANIVASKADFESIPLDNARHTLVSEDTIRNLLHLISNAGPAIECKILQVLVGLTSSEATVENVVAAVKSLGATFSLIQFIGDSQWEIRLASIKLLHNISPYMSQELASSLCGSIAELRILIRIVSECNGISEEQAAAIGLLAQLPERDSLLTKHLLDEGAFTIIISKVHSIRQGESWGARFVTPYLEGLVRVLCRLTYILEDEPATVTLAQENNLTSLFTDLLQTNGLDNVQMISAMALENLSMQSKRLTKIPEVPGRSCSIFRCCSRPPVLSGICKVHHGICSVRESFCLLEGRTVEKLVACLDHANDSVVEAVLSALCTLLEDGVDTEQGVYALCDAHGILPILDVLRESPTEILRQKSVWAVERILRTDEIAIEISGNQDIGAALVEAFRHGDYRTRQIAERALKRVDKLPNFSGIFQTIG